MSKIASDARVPRKSFNMTLPLGCTKRSPYSIWLRGLHPVLNLLLQSSPLLLGPYPNAKGRVELSKLLLWSQL